MIFFCSKKLHFLQCAPVVPIQDARLHFAAQELTRTTNTTHTIFGAHRLFSLQPHNWHECSACGGAWFQNGCCGGAQCRFFTRPRHQKCQHPFQHFVCCLRWWPVIFNVAPEKNHFFVQEGPGESRFPKMACVQITCTTHRQSGFFR